jgi:hypothetical protein
MLTNFEALSRMDLIIELLERSSDRIEILKQSDSVEYRRTLWEVEAIIWRLNDLFITCPSGHPA